MADIETRLGALGETIDWPRNDLAPRVRARIAAGDRASRKLPGWVRVMALLLVFVALILATPGGRQAVADLLGVTGIEITWGEPPEPAGSEFELGQALTIEMAAQGVGFDILVPEEEPDTTYLGDIPIGGAVNMVWRATANLAGSEGTDVAIIYSQFQVTGSELFVKSLDPSDMVERVTVRGSPGFWVEGPHYIVYRDLGDSMREGPAWLSENVLAWEADGVTHRIETTQSLQEALAFAESLRPRP